MARFPIYTDADIHGPLVDGLKRDGWDVLRAVDAYPEGTVDALHFERAAREGRVLVTNDSDHLSIAEEWIGAGRPFRGLIIWQKQHQRRMSVGDILRAFAALAAEDPFSFSRYPIVRLKPAD